MARGPPMALLPFPSSVPPAKTPEAFRLQIEAGRPRRARCLRRMDARGVPTPAPKSSWRGLVSPTAVLPSVGWRRLPRIPRRRLPPLAAICTHHRRLRLRSRCAWRHSAWRGRRPSAASPAHGDSKIALADPSATQPIDIYLHALRFGFAPDDIRDRGGQALPTRMMASDITHGASLQLGRGSRIISFASERRERADDHLQSPWPGPHLLHDFLRTRPHDAMKAKDSGG